MAKHCRKTSRNRNKTRHRLRNIIVLTICAVFVWFGLVLWKEALRLQTYQPAESIPGQEFRPQVGDPPYRVMVDAGHGGADPGARGVVEEKNLTAATASALMELLEKDPNYIPLQTRETTAKPQHRRSGLQKPGRWSRSCCFPFTATLLPMVPPHPDSSAIRPFQGGHGITRAFTLHSCWQAK